MSEELQSSYDRVAEDYAAQFRDEMDKKPFDRKMLDWFAEKVGDLGIICDMGCGPGQIARYLFDHGAKVCGIDLSPGMVERAQSMNQGISFHQGNMLALANVADNFFGGVAAFYSIIHIPRPLLNQALAELKRVLIPGGVLLLTFHIGQEIKHLDQWWGKEVSLDFIFYETEEMKEQLKTVGFELQEVIEREPYPEVEYQSRRAYIFARKP
ncbi:MAG TPA: class I SAM-dependent methyltransferase [Pyrinomonadaceae bacterium]|nr:class I SAM-dependent methyltransferase [Pyrinomonadaceae bacterium]